MDTMMILVLLAAVITLSNSASIGESSCKIEGQVFQQCKTCPATCSNPNRVCALLCVKGCGCPAGQLIDDVTDKENPKCVDSIKCPILPPICATVLCLPPKCASGAETVIPPETAIPPGECCPQCVCKIGDKTYFPGETFKVDCNTCTCTDKGLIACTKIACPDPCDEHVCPTGSQCKVFELTGEPYCEPTCDLDNGGCSDDEVCSLEDVTCVRAPCPPVVKCTPKCPPTCSPDFCRDPNNKYKPCSRPPPFTVPPCPDSCHTTFCDACYYSDTALPAPSQCDNLCTFPPSTKCLYKWASCVADGSQPVGPIGRTFRCYEYPCPLRG